VNLPETVHPALGSMAQASLYDGVEAQSPARLRQLSDAADSQTRTFEARYVLEGDAANAPLGATVTIRIPGSQRATMVEVPIGAIYDGGNGPAVWILDRKTSSVSIRPVQIRRFGEESAILSNGVSPGEQIVALGAQLLHQGLDGAFDDLQKIRDTPIVAVGRTRKLSDLADVQRGYEDPPTFLIRHNGEPALVLGVVMKEGWNGLDLGKALEAEAKKIADELPLGVTFSKITDQAVNIRDAVDEFMLKFFVALLVVMVVSLASLGLRVGIVVAAAVPLTLAALSVMMLMTGWIFDRISLGAIILALGLLVDDAIIAIEMMVVKMEAGLERTKADAYAWNHTAAPMLAGTAHDRRADADRFRAVQRWRVCRRYFLDRGLCFDRVLDSGGSLHALSRRQVTPGDQASRRRPHRNLRDAKL
jgi:hypothetical protein